jgi:acetyl esterase/lipase
MPAVFRSPLATFARFVPKDAASIRIEPDLAYGSDPRQRISLFAPRRAPGRPLPAILFFYGGSWRSGFREGYAFVGRALAAQGFLVGTADYRLVPEGRFPIFLEDCAAATKWLLDNAGEHDGISGSILLVGHSAGAYNAAMLALDPRWLGADHSKIQAWVGIAGPYQFGPANAITTAAFGQGGPAKDAQPVNLASGDSPPTLLLHGGRDTVVLSASSEELARRLRAAGVSAAAKVYPRLDHIATIGVFALPFRGRSSLFSDVVDFCRQHSG